MSFLQQFSLTGDPEGIDVANLVNSSPMVSTLTLEFNCDPLIIINKLTSLK